MILRSVITLFLITFGVAQGALPQWNPADKARLDSGQLIVGRALLTKEGEPENSQPPVTPPSSPLSVTPVPARPELHPMPAILDDRKELSTAILSRYFSLAQPEGVCDPQSILSSQETLDIQYALSVLAEESPVPIYFYVFDKKQKVPPSHSPKKTFKDHYSQQSSGLIVYYFIGQPERCQIYFGGTDASLVPLSKVRDLITGVRLGARRRTNPISQLDEFIRQLSLHLFWIEKTIEEKLQESLPGHQITKSHKPTKQSSLDKLIAVITKYDHYWWMVVLGCGGFVLILLTGVYYVKRRQFTFPVLNVTTRLNLPNGGSMGGIVSYRDENLPPSAQKEQFDDIL